MPKKWVNRHPNATSFADVIKENTGEDDVSFLFPQRNPFLVGLRETAEAIWKYAPRMPVKIVADYDLDGIASALIMARLIANLTGRMPEVRIPRRFSEGFGISDKIIDETKEGLIITVDNGIAFAPQIRRAREKGLKVIITDHHDLGDCELPEAEAILNPNAIPGSEYTKYCGAGLAFRLFNEMLPNSPDLPKMLAFAAIATIADVVDLVGDNRNIVKDGLRVLNMHQATLGLNTLIEEAVGKDTVITASTIGYKIAPILNASGRLFDKGAVDVCGVLWQDTEEGLKSVRDQIPLLIERNETRKKMVQMAMNRLEGQIDESAPVIIEYLDGVSEGIVGIIAGNLKEEYRKPAIVFTDASEKEGIIKGSGRTYGEVDIKALADTVKAENPDLFVTMGGHPGAMAASVKKEDFGRLKEAFMKSAEKVCRADDSDRDVVYYDYEIPLWDTVKMFDILERHEPFGAGNPEPVFKVTNFACVHKYNLLTYKLMGKDEEHIKIFGSAADAIGFHKAKEFLDAGAPEKIEVIGKLSTNIFNGVRNNQIIIEDFRGV